MFPSSLSSLCTSFVFSLVHFFCLLWMILFDFIKVLLG
nr:MAG TPA: hypothetical protein [Caudoviricetes sp.]